MSRTHAHAGGWMLALAGLLGAGLLCVPPAYANLLRSAARDVMQPGQLLLTRTLESGRELWKRWTPIARTPANEPSEELLARLESLEARERRLAAEKAALSDELKRAQTSTPGLPAIEQSTPLMRGELVEARVLGGDAEVAWRSRKSLSTGSAAGIQELALVLEAPRRLLDQGSDTLLAADQPVYAGRTVVGRVGLVGHYSSTLILVTDAEYRGRARLARETPRGLTFGIEGTLKGDGTELCRLDSLPSTEPVSVGDAVFTGTADGVHPAPMYYGTVARAELQPGSLRWSIWVKPAADLEQLRKLHVLRTAVNPNRVLAN